jgi:hypothetical protein
MIKKRLYRCGVLEVWQQRGCVRAGKDSRICRTKQVDGSNAVDDSLNQANEMHKTEV